MERLEKKSSYPHYRSVPSYEENPIENHAKMIVYLF